MIELAGDVVNPSNPCPTCGHSKTQLPYLQAPEVQNAMKAALPTSIADPPVHFLLADTASLDAEDFYKQYMVSHRWTPDRARKEFAALNGSDRVALLAYFKMRFANLKYMTSISKERVAEMSGWLLYPPFNLLNSSQWNELMQSLLPNNASQIREIITEKGICK